MTPPGAGERKIMSAWTKCRECGKPLTDMEDDDDYGYCKVHKKAQEQPDSPTPQPSLRDIIETAITSGVALGRNKKGEFNSEKNYLAKMTHTITEAEQAILALIASAKPEKRKLNPPRYGGPMVFDDDHDVKAGFNRGIDAYEASLLRKLEREG